MSYSDNPDQGQLKRIILVSIVVTLLSMPVLTDITFVLSTILGRNPNPSMDVTSLQFWLGIFFYVPLLSFLGILVFPSALALAFVATSIAGGYLSGWPSTSERHSKAYIWCIAGALIGLTTFVFMRHRTSMPADAIIVYPAMLTGAISMLLWRYLMRTWIARARRKPDLELEGWVLGNEEA